MSEEKKLDTVITYDHTKTITGIDVNAAYIEAFQRILSEMILDAEDPSTLPETFKKFNAMATFKEGDEPPALSFSLYESKIVI